MLHHHHAFVRGDGPASYRCLFRGLMAEQLSTSRPGEDLSVSDPIDTAALAPPVRNPRTAAPAWRACQGGMGFVIGFQPTIGLITVVVVHM